MAYNTVDLDKGMAEIPNDGIDAACSDPAQPTLPWIVRVVDQDRREHKFTVPAGPRPPISIDLGHLIVGRSIAVFAPCCWSYACAEESRELD